MRIDQRIYTGGWLYNFATLRDAAEYGWLRGVVTSDEYVELTGNEPPPYEGEVSTQKIAEIRERMVPVCKICETEMVYSGAYAAPGYGQAWRCTNGHRWCKIGTAFYSEVPELQPEDVI